MHLYRVYQHFDSSELDLIDSSLKRTSVPLEGFDLFYTGARVYFLTSYGGLNQRPIWFGLQAIWEAHSSAQ